MTDAVLFDARDDGIAIITINRPDQRNALGREVREGLWAAWERFENDPELRLAILTGKVKLTGKSGGADATVSHICVYDKKTKAVELGSELSGDTLKVEIPGSTKP